MTSSKPSKAEPAQTTQDLATITNSGGKYRTGTSAGSKRAAIILALSEIFGVMRGSELAIQAIGPPYVDAQAVVVEDHVGPCQRSE
jgi:hypothetical protein